MDCVFFFQAEDGIRDLTVTGVQTCALPILRLASRIEANLIRAEALAQQNQVPAAMALVNARRAQVGLAAASATTQQEAIDTIIAERRKELSFEGGHRLNDLLRYNITWKTGT